ncbi:MAG: MFS transporter [Alphaproteobacteria bacterium]|nr:MFS transporter [Alphaproteobacteria bacterium]
MSVQNTKVTLAPTRADAGGEFARGWRALTAATLGVTCGVTAVPIYTIGAFVAPLEQAYGWSRGAIQSATLFAYATVVVAGPIAGALVDRHGARPVAIWSVLGIALAVASASVLAQSLAGLYVSYALIGLLGAGTAPAVWTRAVSGWFEARRGLALGVTLMGTGIFATLGPRYVTWAIESFGWQGGFLALAAVPLIVVLPAVLAWFREHERVTAHTATPSPVAQTGMTLADAMRTAPFWIIAISFLFFSTVISGFIASYIPMLTDSGMTPAAAAAQAGSIGIAVIAGRIGIGLVLDYLHAPRVAAVVMSLPSIGCLIWVAGTGGESMPLVAAIMVGLAAGAEFDLVAYMTARYFGLLHFGKLTGILFSSIIAGGALGPMAFGLAFDRLGSYDPVLMVSAAVFAIAGLGQLLIGPYPEKK